MVDCGMAFPDDDMPGVDMVINDITYLEKNWSKIKGIFLTHGHEDHIGGLPYFLKAINVPVYGTRLTIGLVEHKLKEHNLLSSVKLVRAKYGNVIMRDKTSLLSLSAPTILLQTLLLLQSKHLSERLFIWVTLKLILLQSSEI
mgnify:CR=1 FL=1